MTTEIIWKKSPLTSSLHAALAAAKGEELVDPRLDAIVAPAQQLAAEINTAQLPSDRFWGHLIALSAMLGSRRKAVETAVTKTIGRVARLESVVGAIESGVTAVEVAARNAIPNIDEELTLRERPLREQWEARGNGLLQAIGRLTEDSLIPDRCEVFLVLPAVGGAGESHLPYNSVRIEGVLANPIAELPEAMRLAWLIAQLQLDVPKFSEEISPERLPVVARLAMIPPALLAAEAVELTRFTPELVAKAFEAWRITAPGGADLAATVNQWWQTYLETRPPWNVALAALDQMLG